MTVSSERLGWGLLRGLGYVFTIIFICLPVIWVGLTAFKLPKDAYSTSLLFTPTLANFRVLFTGPRSFTPLVINSVLVSTFTVVIAIPLAAMSAYVFSRFSFRLKNTLLIGILSSQFIPPIVIVLTFFSVFRALHLLDTRTALVIVNLSFVLPFAVWMIKGFIDALPIEVEEAALVDGCSRMQLLRRITAPLVMPGVITAAVFAFIQSWNEFLFALILTSRQAITLTIGLQSLNREEGILWEQMAVAGLVVMLPIFLLSLSIRKYFIEGITLGAVK
jgi:multiple sugar transport system permease protein